jgi:hypothetical protein
MSRKHLETTTILDMKSITKARQQQGSFEVKPGPNRQQRLRNAAQRRRDIKAWSDRMTKNKPNPNTY